VDLPKLLSIEQVAEYLEVKPRRMRELISKNEIEYVRIGAKTVRITQEAVMDFIRKNTVALPIKLVDDSKHSRLKSTFKRNRSLKSKDETVKKAGDYSDRLSQELKDQWR
jgi:excisionase family DNA binding protein